ncbi:unnamed protein product [Camellia sinensis]
MERERERERELPIDHHPVKGDPTFNRERCSSSTRHRFASLTWTALQMAFENYCGGPDSSLNQSQGTPLANPLLTSSTSNCEVPIGTHELRNYCEPWIFGTIAMIGFLTRRVNQQRRWLELKGIPLTMNSYVCTTKSFVEHAVPALGECVTLHFKAIQFTNNSQPKNIGRADVSG